MTLREQFQQPPEEFRQAPFWFWNHALDKSMLSWQIAQMQDKGLGGFVMHARHGLITPYLSEEWMGCIQHGCEEAKKRGMLAWAYDERDWPSGPAGGEVIKDHAHRLSYLRFGPVAGPQPGEEVVATYTEQPDGTWRRSVGGDASLQAMRFECPAILWFESYLDTMSDEACEAFVRSTYDKHEERFGDLKKLGLAGFFTDEPAFSTYPDDLGRIPWTPELPAAFQAAKGYDLLDRLPALFRPGDAGAQVRHDYWDVATRLFENAFFKRLHDWCEHRGLQLIGHPLGEEPLLFQFRCIGNIFRYLKHQHMPGMDHLGLGVGKGSPIAMTPKMVSSAAILAGRERVMTETFGESGWALSLRDMKWMADWQMVHGINYFIPHAFYYSVSRRRKKDSPPSEFYQAPHWPYYRLFADYTARVTSVLTGGEPVAKIALFYPMGSVWADFVAGTEIPESVKAMEAAFAPLGEVLLSMQRDFVVVDEDSLLNAQVGPGTFTVNGLNFEALVLPPLTTLRAATLEKITAIAAHTTAIAVKSQEVLVLDESAPRRIALQSISGLQCVARVSREDLAVALAPVSPDVLLEQAPEVHYMHRRKEGRDFYFFVNTGRETVDSTLSLESVGAAQVWNPETGNTVPLPDQELREGRLCAPLRLESAGSLLLEVEPGAPPLETPEPCREASQRIQLCPDGVWHFTPQGGNYVALKQWQLSTEMRHKVTELRYSTHFALSERIGNFRLILDGIPEAPYGVPDATRALMGPETQSEILLDGQLVQTELPWEIDCHFRVLDLSHFSEGGRHTLEVVVRNHGWFPQPGVEEYAWLAGDFMAEFIGGAPQLSPCRGLRIGPWEEQGYACFSGTGAYVSDIDLPTSAAGKRILLHTQAVGNLLEVEVNGATVGVRAWPPYCVDITSSVYPGRPNLFVLKVSNTLRNLFEGPDKHHPSGLLSDVWLEIL